MSGLCSHDGTDGRTCVDSRGVFKLFGVRLSAESCIASSPPGAASELSDMSMRKCVSMGNLCNYGDPEARASSPPASQLEQYGLGDPVEGYASDDLVHTNSSSRERKKGVAWTEEEHRSFLTGLQMLGKGDWRGISRNFVRTRTPTQVASHAQKYFMRKNNINKRRRRSSLFDITPDSIPSVLEQPVLDERSCADPEVSAELSLGQSIPHGPSFSSEASRLAGHGYPLESLPASAPRLHLALLPSGTSDLMRVPGKPLERKTMEVTPKGTLRRLDVDVMEVVPELVDAMEGTDNMPQSKTVIGLATSWPGEYIYGTSKPGPIGSDFKILKPIPITLNPLKNADETPKFSETATISVARRVMEPTPLSFKLLANGSRHSAFHVTVPKSGSRDVDGQGGLSSAISVP